MIEYKPTFEEAFIWEKTGNMPESAIKYLSKILAAKVDEDIVRKLS